ncbi:MAG TPA: thrombospondin type 3 repeat-containing protein [Kofleriaceae bacterium]|nr:thrombospondin type 3 repeat-containing protein [Kofleriaceae bacterium]
MRVVAVALLFITCLAAGCYSPGYRDCEITCASGACPSGFSCDQGVCRIDGFSGPCGQQMSDAPNQFLDAMIDGNPMLDSDGDGIKDNVDNCRLKSNPNQENEDGDLFGDVCDPCPPSQNNTDGDGDGVGDLCDPEPTQTGNVITLFDGFNYAQPPANVVLFPSASWTFPLGQVRLANLGGNQRAAYVFPQQGNGQNIVDAVYTSYSISQISTGIPAGVGVVQRFDASQQNGVACLMGRGVTGIPSIRVVATNDEPSARESAAPFQSGQVVEMVFFRAGQQYDCRDLVSPSAVTAPQQFIVPTASVGLYSQGTQADFNWIMVVSRQ